MAESSATSPKKRERRGSIDDPPCMSCSMLTEELRCSVCQDLFTDPVTIPCGHNFCKICLNKCWDISRTCKCPYCNKAFQNRPDLKINTTLREVVDHNTVPVEEEIDEKTKLKITQREVQQMIHEKKKKIEDVKNSSEARKKNTEKEKAARVELFTDLIRSVEGCQTEVQKKMEEQQKAAEKLEEEFIESLSQDIIELKIRDTELEQKITELQKKNTKLEQEITVQMRNTELKQVSHTEVYHHLLQIYSYLLSAGNTSPEISVKTEEGEETLRKALTQLKDTLDKKLTLTDLKRMQKYEVDVTLDPDTAHPALILSDDGKRVREGDIRQKLPDKPERFDPCVSVLGKEGFSSGRFYFEVQVKEKTDWDLGVARESINRKGNITASPSNGLWIVWLRNENDYKACDDPRVPLSVKPQRVGVFVDYEDGLVSFYDVESSSLIYSFTGQSFTGKLYPYFSPCPNYGCKNSTPLVITPVKYNK